MSRTVLSLQMLDLLKTNEIISKSELAKRLKTKKRNIVELRKELEQYGYRINIIPGKQGGYQLIKEGTIKNSEKSILAFLHEYIKKTEVFPQKNECLSILEKYINDENNIVHPSIEIQTISYLNSNKINKHISLLYDAINTLRKVFITYLSLDGNVETILFLPYNFSIRNGQWYCVGKQSLNDNIENKTILISNIIKVEVQELYFERTIVQSNILEDEQLPITYYYVKMVIKDRWDLYYWKFGVNQENEKIDSHRFSVKYITFNKSKVYEIKHLLGEAISEISIKF